MEKKFISLPAVIHNFKDMSGKLRYYFALIAGAFLLIIPAIYNHFPIVNPDTATYIASGFDLETPADRPITYGIIVRVLSLNGFSLWFLIFMQGYLVSWLILQIIKVFTTKAQKYLSKFLLIILFLSLFTPLSWLVSQVQPDVFTSAACMTLFLILSKNTTRQETLFLYFLFFIEVATHISHPLLFCMILALLFLFKKIFITAENNKHSIQAILIMFLLSLSAIVLMGSAMSKSKHVFLIGSLLEKGVLKPYLDEHCLADTFAICAYKDSLPATFDAFVWYARSPLYKIGSWNGTKTSFNLIINNILTSPKYLLLFGKATAEQACHQALLFNIGDGNESFNCGSNMRSKMEQYFPKALNHFDQDKQNTLPLYQQLIVPNRLYIVTLLLSMLFIIAGVVRWIKWPGKLKLFGLIVCISVICNITDCAAFTTLSGRYGCKMIWLFPFLMCLIILNTKKELLSI